MFWGNNALEMEPWTKGKNSTVYGSLECLPKHIFCIPEGIHIFAMRRLIQQLQSQVNVIELEE